MTSPTPFRLLAVSALVAASAGLAAPAHAAEGDASVSVLHAVPGATVDVYANGKALLTDFTPGTLTDPVMLPGGTYDLLVTAAGAGATGTAVTEAKGVTVPAGANITVVAHLTADGKPVLTPYVNDTSAVPAGQARLTVRHDAAAPAVDVRADGTPALTNLTNPKEATAVVPAGTISADVVLANTSTVSIGPDDLPLKEGANTVVYAWGSAADDNLKLAVQTIGGMARGGGRRARRTTAAWLVAAAGSGVLLGVGAAWSFWRAPSAPTTVSSVTLETLDTGQAQGQAVLERVDGALDLRVDSTTLDAGSGYLEVWLINADGRRMVSLGVLRQPLSTFPVPTALIDRGYVIVDVSREGFDDHPEHSSDSLLRGRLAV